MALMERVTTLLRANIRDLLERAEDPEKALHQLVLDIENQLLQVKTQVAMALADQHLLEAKIAEGEAAAADWHRKAEVAVREGDDPLARAALQRALQQETYLSGFRAQAAAQAAEAEARRASYTQLQAKLAETQNECELLLARHRRARTVGRVRDARAAADVGAPAPSDTQVVRRVRNRVHATETANGANGNRPQSPEERFAEIGREDRIDQLLTELKTKEMARSPKGPSVGLGS